MKELNEIRFYIVIITRTLLKNLPKFPDTRIIKNTN